MLGTVAMLISVSSKFLCW